MRIIGLILLMLMLAAPVSGQDILLSEDLRGDTLVPGFGMNRKNFGHFFVGVQKFAGIPEVDSDEFNYSASWAIGCGYRYKRKFSQVLSGVAEWQLKRLAFYPEQWDMLQTSGSAETVEQKLVFLQTGLAAYQRFNYDKRRGNYVGRYIDVGVYGDWSFNTRHIYCYQNAAGEDVRTREGSLDYIQPFEWGVLMRLGFNNLAFTSSCRLSDHFSKSSGIGEMPRFLIGIELGAFPF